MAQNEKDEGDNKLSAEREQPNDEDRKTLIGWAGQVSLARLLAVSEPFLKG